MPKLLLDLVQQEADRRRASELLGPVVLLLDDMHAAWDPWLDFFLDALSVQLPVELYALVIVSLIRPPSPAILPDETSKLIHIARREVARSAAAWEWLRPLTVTELEGWLGPMEGSLSEELGVLTQGNVELASGLWADWQAQGLITRSHSETWWSFSPAAEERSSRSLDNLIQRRLRELLSTDLAEVERMRDTLRLAALEGRIFTADAVAPVSPRRSPTR